MVRFTDDELNHIYDKNDGHCWHSGKKLAFTNYVGFARDPWSRGAWKVDHTAASARGGTEYLRNFVPRVRTMQPVKG